MKCEICDLTYDLDTRTPLVLQCGHTFCKGCLTQSVNRSGHVQCFLDRKVDNRGLAELPKNFALVDSAKLDQQAAAQIRGIHLGRDLWLDERELTLTSRSLGSGATGQVVEGVYKERPVAVKVIDLGEAPPAVLQTLQREAAVVLTVSKECHHTCLYKGATIKENKFCLVMKKYDKSLARVIAVEGATTGLPLHRVVSYGRQTLAALAELHAQSIIMVDLKPQNLLMNSHLDELVLMGFGLSRVVTDTLGSFRPSTMQGTPNYMSPELIDSSEAITPATDMWSWACIVIHMATGQVPFAGLSSMHICWKVCDRRQRPQVPVHLPAFLRDLLQTCLSYDARSRPTAMQALQALSTAHSRQVLQHQPSQGYVGVNGIPCAPHLPSQQQQLPQHISDLGSSSQGVQEAAAAELAKQQQLSQEKRKKEEERLLVALAQPMGFYKGKPLAALVVFRCCWQWRAFQDERASVFGDIIKVIGSQIERHQDDNACLAYWLTNTMTLLHLLERNTKPAIGISGSVERVAAAAAAGRSFMGGLSDRQPTGGEASIHDGGVEGSPMAEAEYPAMRFKLHLDLCVRKIFPVMRDNVSKTITPMLDDCIRKGACAHVSGAAASSRCNSGASAPDLEPGATAQSKAWSDVLRVFDDLLMKLRDNHVPKPVVQAMFKQLFSFLNGQLFNQLLLRRECMSFSNGECVKAGLAQVESWIMEHGPEWVGEPWDELKHIRQAVTFLLICNQPTKIWKDVTRDLCLVLSIQQVCRICAMFTVDRHNKETVNLEVLKFMRCHQAMVEDSDAGHNFLLDDERALPFAADDVLAQMDDKDLYIGLPVPEPLKQASNGAASFAFLKKDFRAISMGPAA